MSRLWLRVPQGVRNTPPSRTIGCLRSESDPPAKFCTGCVEVSMTTSLGKFGESWAAAHLERHGYLILERNVRFRTGELDLIARDGEDLVFVEVKTRRTSRFGLPEDSIDGRRFARLENAIAEYLHARNLAPDSYRVDVVAIEIDARGKVTACRVLKGVQAPDF